MKEWFQGCNGTLSMVDNLLDSTNEIIRKITFSALQIIEMQTSGGSRKEEEICIKCEDGDFYMP